MPFEAWERYALEPMKDLWNIKKKFEYWHAVELAWMAARVDAGEISRKAYDAALAVEINDELVERVLELEKEFFHDLASFVVAVQEQMGEQWAGEYHKRITSYDVEDPVLILMLRQAIELILEELWKLNGVLRERALEFKHTLMIGRTHGQYAEPTTFGHLLVVYKDEVSRRLMSLERSLIIDLGEGKISGPVGIYGEIDPIAEERALKYIGLSPARAETQILQRDRHASVMSELGVLSGTVEQMARTFWEMMRSDTGELREARGAQQRGSSSMPWKRNPILNEQLQGLPRIIRGFLIAQMESIATPEFRDISQSIVERFTFPISTMLLHYAIVRMTKCVENMEVFPERMLENLEKSYGVWAGQSVHNALIETGILYSVSYRYIQQAGLVATDERMPMMDLLSCTPLCSVEGCDDPRTAAEILGHEELEKFFDASAYVKRGIEHIFSNFMISDSLC